MTQTLRQVESEKGREGREGDGKVRARVCVCVCVGGGGILLVEVR